MNWTSTRRKWKLLFGLLRFLDWDAGARLYVLGSVYCPPVGVDEVRDSGSWGTRAGEGARPTGLLVHCRELDGLLRFLDWDVPVDGRILNLLHACAWLRPDDLYPIDFLGFAYT